MSARISKVIVTKSKIEDIGTFAKQKIKKGELVLVTKGKVIENPFIDVEPYNSIRETCFQYDKGHYFVPLNVNGNLFDGIFAVNHSCKPNCGIKDKIKLIALRDIEQGEEITYDYVMTDADYENMGCLSTRPFKCNCGNSECRKVISGKDWLRKDLQHIYKGFLSDYIQNLITAEKVS